MAVTPRSHFIPTQVTMSHSSQLHPFELHVRKEQADSDKKCVPNTEPCFPSQERDSEMFPVKTFKLHTHTHTHTQIHTYREVFFSIMLETTSDIWLFSWEAKAM